MNGNILKWGVRDVAEENCTTLHLICWYAFRDPLRNLGASEGFLYEASVNTVS